MSGQEYEFRSEYLEVADTVEEYAADLLGQARDSKEVGTRVTVYALLFRGGAIVFA